MQGPVPSQDHCCFIGGREGLVFGFKPGSLATVLLHGRHPPVRGKTRAERQALPWRFAGSARKSEVQKGALPLSFSVRRFVRSRSASLPSGVGERCAEGTGPLSALQRLSSLCSVSADGPRMVDSLPAVLGGRSQNMSSSFSDPGLPPAETQVAVLGDSERPKQPLPSGVERGTG